MIAAVAAAAAAVAAGSHIRPASHIEALLLSGLGAVS